MRKLPVTSHPLHRPFTSQEIESLSVAQLTAGTITAKEIVLATSGGVLAKIRSSNYVAGVSGWQVDSDGNAEFNNVTVRGTVVASTGTIGGWTIGATTLTGGDTVLSSASTGYIKVGAVTGSAGTIRVGTATVYSELKSDGTMTLIGTDGRTVVGTDASRMGFYNAAGSTFYGSVGATSALGTAVGFIDAAGKPRVVVFSADDVSVYKADGTTSVGGWDQGANAWKFLEQVQVPLGSDGTPGLSPSGDSNSGFWSPAADTLALSLNAVERVRWSAVTTGEDAGGVKLTDSVASAAAVVKLLRLQYPSSGTSDGSALGIWFDAATDRAKGAIVFVRTASAGRGQFEFLIDNNGDANDAVLSDSVMVLTNAGLTVLGNTVWHAGNDGSGSGLDADLLDGSSSAAFVKHSEHVTSLHDGFSHTGHYSGTTASAATLRFNTSATYLQLTSSEQAKSNIAPVDGHRRGNPVMDLTPIWFKSKSRADRANPWYIGLSAEDVRDNFPEAYDHIPGCFLCGEAEDHERTDHKAEPDLGRWDTNVIVAALLAQVQVQEARIAELERAA